MRRSFRGESIHKVDAKGRVSIPAPFRRVLEDGDPDCKPGGNPTFVLIYGGKEQGYLEGYSINGAEELNEKISRMGSFTRERRILERRLNSQSIYCTVDENGRIVLSKAVREKAGIGKEATFSGMGDKFEVWDPEKYDADMDDIDSDLDGRQEDENPFILMDREPEKG